MDTWMWVVILIVAMAAAAAVAYLVAVRTRSAHLKKRFGPEYDRTVETAGGRKDAEDRLRDVAERRDRVQVVPLSASRSRQYAAEWETIQRQFVDRPVPAVAAADDLIIAVMAERGYPVEGFDERTEMISADHPEVVGHFRAASAIRRRGRDATTEDLREAFVHYRALFHQMLDHHADSADAADAGEADARTRGANRGGRDGNTS